MEFEFTYAKRGNRKQYFEVNNRSFEVIRGQHAPDIYRLDRLTSVQSYTSSRRKGHPLAKFLFLEILLYGVIGDVMEFFAMYTNHFIEFIGIICCLAILYLQYRILRKCLKERKEPVKYVNPVLVFTYSFDQRTLSTSTNTDSNNLMTETYRFKYSLEDEIKLERLVQIMKMNG